ncbi:MAG TPA: hypothetical protein VGD58_20195 [Herpetosiphonaceae bacterium]
MTTRQFSIMGTLAAGPYEIMIAEAAAADDLLAGEAGLREIVDRLRQHYGAMYDAPDAQGIELHAWETEPPHDELREYHIERGSGAAAPPPDPEDGP